MLAEHHIQLYRVPQNMLILCTFPALRPALRSLKYITYFSHFTITANAPFFTIDILNVLIEYNYIYTHTCSTHMIPKPLDYDDFFHRNDCTHICTPVAYCSLTNLHPPWQFSSVIDASCQIQLLIGRPDANVEAPCVIFCKNN